MDLLHYFDSEESAILGVHPIEVTDELADEHLATHPDQHNDRLEAIRRHPERRPHAVGHDGLHPGLGDHAADLRLMLVAVVLLWFVEEKPFATTINRGDPTTPEVDELATVQT